MKFYIGGGWLTWHHEKHARGSLERGVQYHLDMVNLLEGAEGIYLEPAGEGSEVDEKTRLERARALEKLMRSVWEVRPDFQFAVAVGKFNDPSYREASTASTRSACTGGGAGAIPSARARSASIPSCCGGTPCST